MVNVEEFLKKNLAKRVVVQVALPRVVKNPSAYGLTSASASAVCDQRYFGLQEFTDVPLLILPWGSFGIVHEGRLKIFPMDRLYEVEFGEGEALRIILENAAVATKDQLKMIEAMKRSQEQARGGVG